MRSSTRSTLGALLAALVCLAGLAAAGLGAAERDAVAVESARPAAIEPDGPTTRETVITIGGGLLVVVLAGVGLTITVRSLLQDMRGRRHRYRRRMKREPRSA